MSIKVLFHFNKSKKVSPVTLWEAYVFLVKEYFLSEEEDKMKKDLKTLKQKLVHQCSQQHYSQSQEDEIKKMFLSRWMGTEGVAY
jgi:hypothetical protein